MSALSLERISRAFGGVRAVSEVSFAIEPGAVTSLIGPNGAGKTTLINLISGIYRPDAGRILLFGTPVAGLEPERFAALGLSRTFQNLRICMNMGAVENVMIGAHRSLRSGLLAGMLQSPSLQRADAACRERAIALIGEVGLGRYVGVRASEMPYGALKRLELARALAAQPRLLLLDEPAAGLNATETAAIERLIREIAARGTTVLLVEHDMRLVMSVSDRIVVLHHGQVLAAGTPAEVRADRAVVGAYLGAAA